MFTIIGSDGNQYGPITADQLRQWYREGRVGADTQVQSDGGEWRALSACPEFADLFGSSAPVTTAGSPVAPSVPGAAAGYSAPTEKIPNYLVQSILVTLCCCLPLGVPAIVFAAQVNGKQANGDMAGAMESSRKAKMWCWIAFGFGLASNLIMAIIQIMAFLAAHRMDSY